uniref:Secreted protein n=1 Tax=Morchella brunnea TaxID=1174671 RepID=A0A8K1I5I4_9PEZI|nr:hypothetical protein LK370_mgp220 [Morchella brunnea]UBU98360.1 hypothetical protein [Morchella brunnea]
MHPLRGRMQPCFCFVFFFVFATTRLRLNNDRVGGGGFAGGGGTAFMHGWDKVIQGAFIFRPGHMQPSPSHALSGEPWGPIGPQGVCKHNFVMQACDRSHAIHSPLGGGGGWYKKAT